MNHESWMITEQEEEGAATRKNGGGTGASFLLNTLGGAEIKFEDEEIATGNQGDLGQFFKPGSSGLDPFLTNVAVKEEPLPDVGAYSFRWEDDDEELKLNGSDSEDRTPSLLLDPDDHLLLSSGLLSFDELTLHSTSHLPTSTSTSSSSASSSSSSSGAAKANSNPSSPDPSSSPLPSSPSSLLPVAPASSFLSPQHHQHQPQPSSVSSVTYSPHSGPTMPHPAGLPAKGGAVRTPPTASLPPPAPVTTTQGVAVQSAPTTPSSSPRPTRARRGSTTAGSGKTSAAAKKAATGAGSTPPRPRRRRAASTTVARDKQDRMERELANDDRAKAILSGPLTLEKLAALSSLKVSVLQRQLRMVNASTKGSKAQLIQRLVRYLYLFSQHHRHQAHHPHHMLCNTSTCEFRQQQQQKAGATGGRCSGPFVDPSLINADNSVRAKAATVTGEHRARSNSAKTPSVMSSSAPSSSFASSFLSPHTFPPPLQITLTGRIVEEEEEEEFSD